VDISKLSPVTGDPEGPGAGDRRDYANQTTEPMRKGLVQKITNESIFLKRLRFIPVDGFTYEYRRQDTLGGIAFRALNASYTPDQGVVNPYIESLAIFGGEVRTDRQIVNKQGDVVRANRSRPRCARPGCSTTSTSSRATRPPTRCSSTGSTPGSPATR
jgi:hypothetical protein